VFAARYELNSYIVFRKRSVSRRLMLDCFYFPCHVGVASSGLICSQDYPKHRHPGWNKGSIGYHADDGKIFIGSGVGAPFGPRCHKGDRMGCGILFPRDYVCQYDRYGLSACGYR
jgi:hypothetical protein